MPQPPKLNKLIARRIRDRAYDLACRALADESPEMPDDAVIEARAAQYREYLDAGEAEEKALDLAAIQQGVNARVKTMKKRQPGRGLPRPKEVLRNAPKA